MAAAAKRIIPVTLELGGKSPVIVAKDANLAVAARRILAVSYANLSATWSAAVKCTLIVPCVSSFGRKCVMCRVSYGVLF